MFLSFSKTLAKFGGFRIGAGIRMTKKNAVWMLFALLFILIFQMMWYMMIFVFWIIYAMIYGLVCIIKKLCQASKEKKQQKEG